MSSNFRFEMNPDGVKALLQSVQMQKIISSAAEQVVNSAGDGYQSTVKVGQRRAYATISAVSYKARKSNLKNNTLLKALGSLKG